MSANGIVCNKCGGGGLIWDDSPTNCDDCGGSGVVVDRTARLHQLLAACLPEVNDELRERITAEIGGGE